MLVSQCNVCSVRNANLLRCSTCRVTVYCGAEHQSQDWKGGHKQLCSKIKRSRAKLEAEDAKLRVMRGDILTPEYPFRTSVGYFWGILETRDYMRARMDFVFNILKIDSYEAVKTAVEHMLDMICLCRSDNLGVRDIVVSQFLRLGRDQECYDFAVWWLEDFQNDSEDDYGSRTLPYSNPQNDPLNEDVKKFCGMICHHAISVTLIKLRMLLDLRDQRDAATAPKPKRSTIWETRPSVLTSDPEATIEMLENQVDTLYRSVDKANKYIWKALLAPERCMKMAPMAYSMGSQEEMVLLVQYNSKSWEETDGALEWLRTILAK